MTKPQSGILAGSRKLLQSTRPKPSNAALRVDKFVIYLEPSDVLLLMDAVDATTAKDLEPIGRGGNHQGRAIAAICQQWLKGRAK